MVHALFLLCILTTSESCTVRKDLIFNFTSERENMIGLYKTALKLTPMQVLIFQIFQASAPLWKQGKYSWLLLSLRFTKGPILCIFLNKNLRRNFFPLFWKLMRLVSMQNSKCRSKKSMVYSFYWVNLKFPCLVLFLQL